MSIPQRSSSTLGGGGGATSVVRSSSSLGGGGGAAAAAAATTTTMLLTTPFILTFSLLVSLPILFLLAPRIFPSPASSSLPIPDTDELDDLSLFRRAVVASSALSSSSSLPSSHSHLSSAKPARLKIAFLFLTNTDLHFAPLWEQFFADPAARGLYTVYVHADPAANVTRPRSSSSPFRDRFLDRSKRTYRASPTLISATRRLLATALLDDPANAFFAVLSQYCVPLRSFRYVYRSLVSSPTFDRSLPDPATAFRRGVRLAPYRSFIEVLSDEPRLWKRYVARGRYAMLPEVPFDKFRVGSQFFVLTRRHALEVIKDRTLWKKFKLPCYRADECYPEEHYFPTLLSMADADGLTRYTLTRVN